jgi:hypothetical protein
MGIFFLIFLIIIITALFAGVFFYRKKVLKYLSFDFSGIKPVDGTYQFINELEVKNLQFNTEKDDLEQLGQKIKQNKVDSLYILHGTFVGEDPFHWIGLLENSLPQISQEIIKKIRQHTKKGQDRFTKDLGNFVEEHEDLLKSMTLGSVPVYNFTWSSGNHHYARVIGAFKLIVDLSFKHKPGDRILLIGHSHAGQVFALISKLVQSTKFCNQIFSCLDKKSIPPGFLLDLKKVGKLNLDFVTLGTPVRYEWDLSPKMRLLHIINHRRQDILGGSSSGASFTRDGDYIQQWGIPGSDIRSPVRSERDINDKLDLILGAGTNYDLFKENVKKRNRMHNQGHHLFVDYGDSSKLPNFLQTIFGHGCYTKVNHLKFLMTKIIGHFYD